MEKFTLINKARARIKVFETFEDSSKNSSMINLILISYGVVFKWPSNPVMKAFFKKWLVGTLPKIWHY